jgi:hypothetical protein
MRSKQNDPEWNENFPLDEYCAVYGWIGRWAEATKEPELRAIAQAASESLHAVGLVVLETMRSMNESGSCLVRSHGMKDRATRTGGGAVQSRPA